MRELYASWESSLIEALRQHDSKWNSQLESAWRSQLQPAIELMKSKYESEVLV